MAADISDGKKNKSLGIFLLLVLALALRLGWGVSRPVSDAAIDALPDQREYLSIAQNVLQGRGFSFLDKRFDDTVYAFRTPGYPLFLAGCGGNIRAARVAQALLDTSTVLAVYLLARLLTRRSEGAVPFAAAAIVALNPYLIYFTGLLLSETLFTAMLAWGMLLMIAGNGGRGPKRATLLWLLGAVLLAMSVLVRPSALILAVLLGILASFVNCAEPVAYQNSPDVASRRGRAAGAWPLPPGLTLIGLILLTLLPWALRNRSLLGRWIWLDTNTGFTLYDGYNPNASGASDQDFVQSEPVLQTLSEADRSEYLSQKAIQYARTHPSRVWELGLVKLARTWSVMPLSNEYNRPQLRLVALVYSVPFDILVLAGLIWGKLPRSAKLFLLAPALYFTMVHALTVGSLRYRIPAEPPMAVIAASLLAAGGGALEPWRRMR